MIDLHIHTKYSDGVDSVEEILKKAEDKKLKAISITDHDTTKGSKVAIAEAKDKNIIIVPSIEISSSKGHIIGFGVDVDIPKDLSPYDTIDKIYDNGGIAIIPHPFSSYRNGLLCNVEPTELEIEAIEVKNSRYIFGYSNYRSKILARKKNLAMIGASDSHFIGSIGDSYTEIKDIGSDPTTDDIIDGIKSRRTVAKGKKTSNYLIAKEVFNKKFRRLY